MPRSAETGEGGTAAHRSRGRPKPPAAVRLARFDDPGMLAAVAPWGRFSFTPLRGANFRASLIHLDLGDLLLEGGASDASVTIGRLGPDAVGVLLPLDRTPGRHWCGCAVEAGDILVCGAGASYEVANLHGGRWAVLTMRAGDLADVHAIEARAAIRRVGRTTLIGAPRDAVRAMASLARAALRVAQRSPANFQVPEARRALRAALLEGMNELLNDAGPLPSARERKLAPTAQRAIVHAADAALIAEPARGADLRALAAAAGTDEAGLAQAIMTVLGLSASRFVLRRRLMLAHGAFDAGLGDIEAVARAHGFTRIDRFQAAYRAMFGTRPAPWH